MAQHGGDRLEAAGPKQRPAQDDTDGARKDTDCQHEAHEAHEQRCDLDLISKRGHMVNERVC